MTARRRQYVYRGFERFWHWAQSILILFLAFTGFEIHGSYRFFGFEHAVRYHSVAAIAFIVLIVFAVFWHLTSGEWRQYVPTTGLVSAYLRFYVLGIFRDEPHPTRKTARIKFNPLQRLVYLGLKILVVPTMAVSGLLYMFYRYPQRYGIEAINIRGLESIALFHTLGGFLLVAFVIAHIYLISTGESPTFHLEAMVTGYEELDTGDTEVLEPSSTLQTGGPQ